MERPNPAEEKDAARLDEFLEALRQNPTADPGELDPTLAQVASLAVEAEQAHTLAAKPYADAAKNRVWQKTLASQNAEKAATEPGQSAFSTGLSSVEQTRKIPATRQNYHLPETPGNIKRKLNWPRILSGGMAATIVVILGLFAVALFSPPSSPTPVSIIGSGITQTTPTANQAVLPTPTQTVLPTRSTLVVQPTASPTLAPTIRPTPTMFPLTIAPTPAPYLSSTITLTISAGSFTEDQAFATKKVLETRMLALGFTYAVATVNGNQITLDIKGNVSRDSVLETVSVPGRIEFVDTSGGKTIQQGDQLQTTYCSTGSLLKPQTGLCVETAHDPKTTPTATSTTTADGKPFQTILTGEDLLPESLTIKKGDTGYDALDYSFTPEAAAIMRNFTETHIGQQMAITLNGQVLVAATIQGVIADKGELTSANASFTTLLAFLKSGPLPLPLIVVSMS